MPAGHGPGHPCARPWGSSRAADHSDHGDLQSGEAIKKYAGDILLERVSVPQDVASMVSFLASEYSDCSTGQTMLVDGGMEIS